MATKAKIHNKYNNVDRDEKNIPFNEMYWLDRKGRMTKREYSLVEEHLQR